MRYIEFNDGAVVLAPRRTAGHDRMLKATGRTQEEVASAGFIAGRRSASDPVQAFGESVALGGIPANPALVLPETLYAGFFLASPLFVSDARIADRLKHVELASWGMTPDGDDGLEPIYVPLYSQVELTAVDYLVDYGQPVDSLKAGDEPSA